MFMERENNDEIEIDLLEVAGELWRHFWVIVLSMIVFGAAAFSYANFLITPLYHSEAKVYVNNSNLSVGSTAISLTDLNAAQSLVDTYIVILKSRPTLEDVIEKANVSYTYEQLESMISASSVDGTEVLHDLYRVDAAGQPTHKRVMEGIQVLQRHQVDYNVLCVVTKQAAQKAEEVFDALALHRYLQFIPCLDELNGQKHEFSLDASGYGSFLIHTFDRYEKAWRKNRPISIRTFDNWIGMLLGNPPESCGMSGCCGQYYLVEADGSVYPCDFYVLDEWRMGNIKETSFFRLASSEIGERFRKMSWRLPESCRSCPYVALCRGGCRREREPFVDNEPSLSCLCEGNKRFFDARMSQLKQLARNIQSLQSYRKEH